MRLKMDADARKHCHESALMTAAHILICLTQERKSIKDIAKDFDNNLELVMDRLHGWNKLDV